MKQRQYFHQRGVAIVTALLLTTLALTVTAGLFWQQQVAIRALENQRLEADRRWLLRSTLDWALGTLRSDAQKSGNVDYLGQTWSIPVMNQRIDGYADATLSRRIVDAQAYFNLTNLAKGGAIDKAELAAFERLLSSLSVSAALAEPIAQTVARNAPPLLYVDDLLAVPGVTPQVVERLRNYVVVLPTATPVNLNTAATPVLAACFEDMTASEAASLQASRAAAYFRDAADFASRLTGTRNISAGSNSKRVGFSSQYFLVDNQINIGRAHRRTLSLLKRDEQAGAVLWTREQ